MRFSVRPHVHKFKYRFRRSYSLPMDPRRVLTFRVVAHERSFSRAARELSLSQPSVSTQVAQLERELGRGCSSDARAGSRLTPEGETLLEHADAIAGRLELARTQIAAASAGRRARLRIGALPTALAGLVPAAIERLRRTDPDIQVTFDEGTSEELSAKLSAGELDLAIVYQDAGVAPNAPRAHHLLRERFMVALAPDHPLAAQPDRTPRRPPQRRLDRRPHQRRDRPSVPRRRLRAPPRLHHPRPTRDPRADRPGPRGHARPRTPRRPVPRTRAPTDRRLRHRARRIRPATTRPPATPSYPHARRARRHRAAAGAVHEIARLRASRSKVGLDDKRRRMAGATRSSARRAATLIRSFTSPPPSPPPPPPASGPLRAPAGPR